MKYGLLGEKLSHSFSPQIYALLADYTYDLFEVAPQDIASFLAQPDLAGCNVTVPYKQTVMPYLGAVSPIAKRIGSVNTIVKKPDGSLYGDNTDYDGLLYLFQKSGIPVSGKKVAILGSGGTSKTAQIALQDLGAREIVVLSRKGGVSYPDSQNHLDAQILLNTTPVGMYPNNGHSPVDLSVFTSLQGVVDVVYNPLRTKLILDAQKMGIPVASGLDMLVAQAHKAAELFTSTAIPQEKIKTILAVLRRQKENIVLVGMPGSGKSCIGAEVAKLMGRTFIDIDDHIVKKAGKSIPAIFEQDGEAAFRKLECEMIQQFGKQQSLVIATGGGAVLNADNYAPLAQNGHIYHLKRPLERLATEGRPLSLGAPSLYKLYTARKPYYKAFSHSFVQNNAAIIDAANTICEDFYAYLNH